ETTGMRGSRPTAAMLRGVRRGSECAVTLAREGLPSMLRSAPVKRDVRSCVSAAVPLALALALALGGCHAREDAANRAAVANLDQALNPTFLVAALRKLGGA